MKDIRPKADFIFEVSYETAIGVGGIHRVLESKARHMTKVYGDEYIVIGIYDEKKTMPFEPEKIPDDELQYIFDELEKDGLKCHYGTWLVPGRPKAILIDVSKYDALTKINRFMLKNFKVKVKYNFDYYDSFALWGYATGILVEKMLTMKRFKDRKGVLHAHEWVSAIPLLYVKHKELPIDTVFTTHATMLGRSMASAGKDIAKMMHKGLKTGRIARDSEAKNYKSRFGYSIEHIHKLEKITAHKADVFTAVSDNTADEAYYMLGRCPDVVTPNALDDIDLPSHDDLSALHLHSKARIHNFLNAYFAPYYPIDVSKSLLLFTAGRYELNTKGYEILIDSLKILNETLKKENYEGHIFVFFFIMRDVKEVNDEVLGNLSVYDSLVHEIEKVYPVIRHRLLEALIHERDVEREMFFDDEFIMNTKRLIGKFVKKNNKNPPLSTYEGITKKDPLISLMLKNGLDNEREDKVKVIFYPAPVNVADGLLSMDYFDAITGMHLGIFPSLYEPWGYTPQETSMRDLLSITTDVSGFGKFIMKKTEKKKSPGIQVLKTEGRNYKQMVADLASKIHNITSLSRPERIRKKLDATELALLATWDYMISYYVEAHNKAVTKNFKKRHLCKIRL